eukprot:GHVS01056348.1.p1 GENE.GHVS01056348.1~~GHVS01056348.1.p1  ORF type:complete len:739 (-),score=91.29 GHVS01056348.1:471-2687(-)
MFHTSLKTWAALGESDAEQEQNKYLDLTTDQLKKATEELTKLYNRYGKLHEALNRRRDKTQHLSVVDTCMLVKAVSFKRGVEEYMLVENYFLKLDGEIIEALTLLKDEHNDRVDDYDMQDVNMGLITKLHGGDPERIHFENDGNVEIMKVAVCSSPSVENLWKLYSGQDGLEEVVKRRATVSSLRTEMAGLLRIPDDTDNSLPNALAQKDATSYRDRILDIHSCARKVLKDFKSPTLIWVTAEDPNVPTTESTERPCSDVVVHMLTAGIAKMYGKGQLSTEGHIEYVENFTAHILEADRLSTDSTKSDDFSQVERKYNSSLLTLRSLPERIGGKTRNHLISSLFSPIVAITRKRLIASVEAAIVSIVLAVGHLERTSLDVVPAGNQSDTSVVGVLHRLMKAAVEKLEATVKKLTDRKYRILADRLLDVGNDIREAVNNSESHWAITVDVGTKIALTALLMFLGGVAQPVDTRSNSSLCLDQLADSLPVVGTYPNINLPSYWSGAFNQCFGDVESDTLFRGVIHFWSWQLAHYGLREIEEGCTLENKEWTVEDFETRNIRRDNVWCHLKEKREQEKRRAEVEGKLSGKKHTGKTPRRGVTKTPSTANAEPNKAKIADTKPQVDVLGLLENEANAYRNLALQLLGRMPRNTGRDDFEDGALKDVASNVLKSMIEETPLKDKNEYFFNAILGGQAAAITQVRVNLLAMATKIGTTILKDALRVIKKIEEQKKDDDKKKGED